MLSSQYISSQIKRKLLLGGIMKLPKMTFAAAGDAVIQRLIPTDFIGAEEIRKFVHKADARFFNLETVLHRGGPWGNQFNGGSFHRSDPKVLDILKELILL